MKILVNGLQLSKQFSGVQYYLENFLEAFSYIEQIDIKLFILLPKDHKSKVINKENIEIYVARINSKNRFVRIFYEHLIIPYLLKKLAIDTLFCPSYILPFFAKRKSVVVIHDLIALDFSKLCSWSNAMYFSYFLPRSIKKAGKIITGSAKVKEDILLKFDIPRNSISVIKHGIPPRFKPIKSEKQLEFISAKYSLPENFILFVGNIEPKKNIETLIDAFSLLNMQNHEEYNLVLVGQLGWKYRKLIDKIHNSPFKEKVYFAGYIDEQDLPGIYNLSQLLVLPSLYEGFGYPVLEAMACKTPVICSKQGALPEISGGNCLFIDTNSPECIAENIKKLRNDVRLRELLIQKGYEWVGKIKTKQSVLKTIKLFRELQLVNETC